MKLRILALGAMAAAAPALAHAQQPARDAQIETQQLQALDAWTVGTLTGAGALPRDAWANTDPAVLAALYDRLPAVYESPAAQLLARRVLLSGANAPRGDANAAVRKRFEALGRMGAADELSQMASGANAALNDAQIAQYAAQAELARGRRNEACARGRAALGETPAHFILRLRAYCAAAGGDRAAADLALELARGNGGEDAWYTAAVSAAAGAPPARLPAARYDNSLSAALSLAARLSPGANPLANSSTLALTTLARDEATPQPIRAQAAAMAFRRGAISAADARTILAATPAEVTSGLPPLVSALRTMAASRGAPALAAIAGVLRQASSPADFAAAARFFHDDIASLTSVAGPVDAPAPGPAAPVAAPPAPTMDAASAVLFARAAIVTGDARLAQRLIESALGAGADAAAMAPLDAALAIVQNARGEAAQMAVQRRIDGASAQTARAAARDVALLSALGFPLDGAAQAFVLANAPQAGARADAGAMAALDAAVERGATGEAALLAVIASGDGVARLDADSAADIVRALRAARLEGDARRLAAEAVLAGVVG